MGIGPRIRARTVRRVRRWSRVHVRRERAQLFRRAEKDDTSYRAHLFAHQPRGAKGRSGRYGTTANSANLSCSLDGSPSSVEAQDQEHGRVARAALGRWAPSSAPSRVSPTLTCRRCEQRLEQHAPTEDGVAHARLLFFFIHDQIASHLLSSTLHGIGVQCMRRCVKYR